MDDEEKGYAQEGSGAGSVAGFQVPVGVQKRKSKVDELLAAHPDIGHGVALSYLSSLDDTGGEECGGRLDRGEIDAVADEMRSHAARQLVKSKVKEVVRKKAGGGGYVLYAPNRGKKGKARSVGSFPTKLGAKRAELARYPPKDPEKLKRMRKDVQRLIKDPKKAAEKEKAAKVDVKKESVLHEASNRRTEFMHRRILSRIVSRALVESLFREEKTDSEWDDYISRVSKQALAGDSKFQKLQKNITRRTEGILDDSFASIRKAVGKRVKLKSYGIKSDQASGQTYLAFGASFDNVSAEPIYIRVQGGVPRIELSSDAKIALTKTDPDDAKLFRAELIQVQEGVLDSMDDLTQAIQSRDKYLEKLETEVDSYIAGLSSLQISLLKQLLAKKYRKVS